MDLEKDTEFRKRIQTNPILERFVGIDGSSILYDHSISQS